VAVHAGDRLEMQAVVASPDGTRQIRRRLDGMASRPAELGKRLAEDLAEAGAIAILDEVR
jgi:hydroxymethylbilane synthase